MSKRSRNIILFLFLTFFSGLQVCKAFPVSDSIISIVKPVSHTIPHFSGDLQYQSVNLKLEKPVKVKVVMNDSLPITNFPVSFEIVSFPEQQEGFKIFNKVAYTDTNGIAKTYIRLGSEQGEYEITAKISTSSTENMLIYKLYARESDWVFMLIIGLLGGLGLFLLGMHMMSEGMQKTAGDKLRSILGTLTNNRFVGVGIGTFVTMAIQSSSATTVMLVSFVQSGLMKFSRSLGVILGAAIGTTITAQLIAFRLTDYSLLLIAAGFFMTLFIKSVKYKHIGETVLGFGILFFGMHIMSESMYPLRSYDPFIEMLLRLENPVLGILAGTLFTALIQSSSAFIGIMIILASQGFLSLEASIPLIFGSNIGTAVTAILASINMGREAKKVALAHTLFKVLGVIIFITWISTFAEIIEYISPKGSSGAENINILADVVPRQIANTHTVFNVVLTVLLIPFTTICARAIDRILPAKKEEKEEPFKLKYIDYHFINTPALALNLAKQESLRMSGKVQTMVRNIISPFLNKDRSVLEEIQKKEREVDYLREQIKAFLLKITRENTGEERIQEAFQMMYTIKELEQMADIVSTNLYNQAIKWLDTESQFSVEGKKEIHEYHVKCMKQLSRAIEVFREINLEKAREMKQKYEKYSQIAMDLERQHYERLLGDVERSVSSSKIHIEVISMLRAISTHATNIARILLEWSGKNNL